MQSYLRASPVRGTSTSLFVQGTIPRDFRGRTSTLRGCVTEVLVLWYRLLLALRRRLDSVDDRQILDLLECVGKNAPSPAYRSARERTNVCLRQGIFSMAAAGASSAKISPRRVQRGLKRLRRRYVHNSYEHYSFHGRIGLQIYKALLIFLDCQADKFLDVHQQSERAFT